MQFLKVYVLALTVAATLMAGCGKDETKPNQGAVFQSQLTNGQIPFGNYCYGGSCGPCPMGWTSNGSACTPPANVNWQQYQYTTPTCYNNYRQYPVVDMKCMDTSTGTVFAHLRVRFMLQVFAYQSWVPGPPPSGARLLQGYGWEY